MRVQIFLFNSIFLVLTMLKLSAKSDLIPLDYLSHASNIMVVTTGVVANASDIETYTESIV